jgi:hypothetical protein
MSGLALDLDLGWKPAALVLLLSLSCWSEDGDGGVVVVRTQTVVGMSSMFLWLPLKPGEEDVEMGDGDN